MRTKTRFLAFICTALLFSAAAKTIDAQPGSSDQVERGRYLADEVAKCGDCHTPKEPAGQPDKSMWLKGSPLTFAPIGKPPKWEDHAPDLTPSGRLFQRWGEKGIATFLATGKGPRGDTAEPPMPTYTLKQNDAEAIVAYLKTLK
jgi:mono/diheme cytochrome c family protein